MTSSIHVLWNHRSRNGPRKQTRRILRHCPIRAKVDQTQEQTPLKALPMPNPSQVTSLVEFASLQAAPPQKQKQAGDALVTQQSHFLKGSIWPVLKGSVQRKGGIYAGARRKILTKVNCAGRPLQPLLEDRLKQASVTV